MKLNKAGMMGFFLCFTSSVTTILRGIDSDIRAMSATMNEVNQAER